MSYHPEAVPQSPTAPRRGRKSSLVVLFVTAMALTVGLFGGVASAHTAMVGGAPEFDATVGGTVDFVNIAYSDPVSNATVAVSYNEELLPGVTTVNEGQIIRFQLDTPLELPGRYKVEINMVSYDSDATNQSYFFTYDPAAPQPQQLSEDNVGLVAAEVVDDGGPGAGLIGGLLLLTGLGAAGMVKLATRNRSQVSAG